MTDRAGPDADQVSRLSLAIETLIGRWAGIVEAAAVRYGLDGYERDDLVQRVRVRIWRALERRQPGDRELEAGYAHSAAVSAAIDIAREQRARGARAHVPLHLADQVIGSGGPGPSESELVAALEAALGRLDPARRVAVRLHLAGRHAKDIARMSGWTEAKARNLLYRGLADLRQALEGDG
jgi:RNA polymerase sigma factor (sigma-70 family)